MLIIIDIIKLLKIIFTILSPPIFCEIVGDNHTSNNNLLSIAHSLIYNIQKVNNEFTKKQYYLIQSLSKNCLGFFVDIIM